MFPEIEGGTLNQQKKKLAVLGKKSLGTSDIDDPIFEKNTIQFTR